MDKVNREREEYLLTTIDNPFDPFEEFEEWYRYDEEKGYHTCSYLDRVATTSNELSEADEEAFIAKAIDEIVELNVLGIYKKVKRKTKH